MLIVILILVLILITHSLVVLNTNYVYDLMANRTCNYFEIYDVVALSQKSPECNNTIHIDEFLPVSIKIKNFPDKGWGLVSQIPIEKNTIIYKSLLARFPSNGSTIEIISKDLGIKKIDKDVHCGDIEKIYDIFSYYDCLLNHDDNPSAYHDDELIIDNGNIYIVLKAAKTINVGEELTINYFYINKYVFYMRSYISYVSKIAKSTLAINKSPGTLNS